MKLKYYTEIIAKLILFSIVVTIILTQMSQAALLTSTVSSDKIFKCGASTIAATFDNVGIISVNANVYSENPVIPFTPGSGNNQYTTESTTVALAFNGTHWIGTFGNNASLLWGNRLISYAVNTGVTTTYTSGSEIFVYSDKCTGTGVTNYTQVSNGLGKYTRMLYLGQFDFIGNSFETSIIGWAVFPFVEVFGYIFYLLVVFTVTTTIYLKTQNIIQPLAVGIFLLLVFAPSVYIDPIYRQWILFFMGIAIAALYYRTFVRD